MYENKSDISNIGQLDGNVSNLSELTISDISSHPHSPPATPPYNALQALLFLHTCPPLEPEVQKSIRFQATRLVGGITLAYIALSSTSCMT